MGRLALASKAAGSTTSARLAGGLGSGMRLIMHTACTLGRGGLGKSGESGFPQGESSGYGLLMQGAHGFEHFVDMAGYLDATPLGT